MLLLFELPVAFSKSGEKFLKTILFNAVNLIEMKPEEA
jgi:hypothetical protein